MFKKGIGYVSLSLPYLVAIGGLYFAYHHSYIFFHTMVELFAFVVSGGMMMLVWNGRKIINNNFLIFLSVVYFFVGIIIFYHTAAYPGLPFFTQYGSSLSTQLWIAERFLLAASIPIAFRYINRKLNEYVLILIYLIITSLLLLSIFEWRIFPLTYIEGQGLTRFKVVSEYIIIMLFGVGLWGMYINRKKFDVKTGWLLSMSLIFNIVAEALFTIYFTVYDLVTVAAHILVLFSYYFVYKAIIGIGLVTPYRLLFLEMQELGKRKDELLYVTSHELKNPLNNLQLYTQLLDHKMGQNSDEENYSIVNRIQNQAERINRLISDLNDIGKIETGQMYLIMTQIDPCKLVKEVVEEAQKQQPNRKISLRCYGKIPEVRADRARLLQVLNNLLSNAIKYSPEGSPVRVGIGVKDGQVIFDVQDKGEGITRENLSQVFNKYFRQKANLKIGGLGLGLYISKEIINQHRGKIWVKSQLHKGSTFYFSLPVGGIES